MELCAQSVILRLLYKDVEDSIEHYWTSCSSSFLSHFYRLGTFKKEEIEAERKRKARLFQGSQRERERSRAGLAAELIPESKGFATSSNAESEQAQSSF